MKRIVCALTVILLFSTIFFNINVAGEEKIEATTSSEQYEGGYRYNIQGWIYLHIEGEPYARGYQHGYLLADEIIDMIERWNSMFPQKWSWNLQKQSAVRLFWQKYPEEYKQEIRGIADGVSARGGKTGGSEIDYKDILTLNEMYESLSRFRRYSVYPLRLRDSWWGLGIFSLIPLSSPPSDEIHTGKCSAFLATGDSTKDGNIVAAHSTYGGAASEGYWWHNYIAGRWNVLLDIQPENGNRMLFSTSPGLIWSDEDFYQNDAGMILMETTLPLGPWTRFGDPVVVRARKAIQYSDSIDDMIDCFLKKNNGLMANDWLMGDTKTGEIASLELALRNHGLTRTKNGFIWSCNNPKDDKVRWELNSFSRLGFLGRVVAKTFKPSNRDIRFGELLDKYDGEIDVDVAKKIMTAHPIQSASTDCKITSSHLIDNFGLWAFMGKPDGTDFIADEHPFNDPKPRYGDMPACGWVQVYALHSQNNPQFIEKKVEYASDKSRLFWEYKAREELFGNAVYSSPTIQDNKLYATSWNGDVVKIDIGSGNKLWETNIGWSSESSPIINDDMVFVGSSEGLFAINKETGDIKWQKKLGSVSSQPAFIDGFVYCGSHDGNVYAFDSKKGTLEWTYHTGNEIYSSPIIDNNILYVGSNDGYIYAIDIQNGKEKWSYETGGAVCSSPLVCDGVIYIGSWDNNLYALESKTGNLQWKFTAGWGIDSSPAIDDNNLYVGCEDNTFYALDVEEGTVKWTFTANAGISSSPTAYGGLVFFGCSDGNIYALDASTGNLIWKDSPDYYIDGILNYVTKPIVSSPALYDGRLYIGSTNGKIYCYDAQTFEQPTITKEIEIHLDTWLFVIIPLFCIILATTIYLLWERRKLN